MNKRKDTRKGETVMANREERKQITVEELDRILGGISGESAEREEEAKPDSRMCGICGKTFGNIELFRAHLYTHLDD